METAESLLRAAADHDIEQLRALLKTFSPNIQEPETLNTPLHAAIKSLEGIPKPIEDSKLRQAEEAVGILLENGAIWNPLNKEDKTPGCIALKLGLSDLYNEMVMAGVRAELIFNRLDGGLWQEVQDDDENEEETAETAEQQNEADPEKGNGTAELEDILNHNKSVEHDAYLSGDVSFDNEKLLSENGNAVMMSWETEIMEKTASALLQGHEGSPRAVLNIGFGMGIIDTEFQKHLGPSDLHYIVEAHPGVLKKMKKDGWFDKKNVHILEGKWQDVLPQLMAEKPELTFTAIYYDTFGENYADLKEFFSEFVISLLDPEAGKFSFFHGLGADRQICYDVYTRVVEMDLSEAGLDVAWEDIHVPPLGEECKDTWEKVTRLGRYWVLDNFKLPICSFS